VWDSPAPLNSLDNHPSREEPLEEMLIGRAKGKKGRQEERKPNKKSALKKYGRPTRAVQSERPMYWKSAETVYSLVSKVPALDSRIDCKVKG